MLLLYCTPWNLARNYRPLGWVMMPTHADLLAVYEFTQPTGQITRSSSRM
jgi:hypothetical protein